MKVFISGAISGKHNYNRLAFYEAEQDIIKQGHIAVSPAILPLGFEHDEYMHICYAIIDCCDAVYFLTGWSDSRGSQLEMDYAQNNGKRILYQE